MGHPGSGKTVLANQLASKITNAKVFDDYYDFNKNKLEIQSEIAKVRRTKKPIFITTRSPHFLHDKWSVGKNHFVTWILTSLSMEDYERLSEKGFASKYLKKLLIAWKNVCSRKGIKTRPYLSITLNQDRTRLVYHYHRFKNLGKKI